MPKSEQAPSPSVQRLQARNVFSQLYSADSIENLLFSPVSAEIVLAVLLNGVSGESASAIRQLLNLDDTDAEVLLLRLAGDLKTLKDDLAQTELLIASALWWQEGRLKLRADLVQLFRDALGVDLRAEDFKPGKNAQTIFNKWVSEATKDKISELTFPSRPPWVPSDQPFPMFIGANALYLKANWYRPFDKYPFGTDFFKCLDGVEQEMTFMMYYSIRGASGISYLRGDGYHAVQIPFEDEQLVLEVFLPYGEDGLGTMMQKLELSSDLEKKLQFEPCSRIFMLMPVFEMESRISLSYGTLGKQLAALFRPGSEFDLMFVKELEDEMLGLADVVQASWLRVDETGVEAAAVTGFIGGGTGSARRIDEAELVVFEADHPFMYQIRHLKSDRVLFMGTLVKPVPSEDPCAIRGDLEWKKNYDERFWSMGGGGPLALQASLLYAWAEGQPIEDPGFKEMLLAVWKWAENYQNEGSYEEFVNWLKDRNIDLTSFPPEWQFHISRKDGSIEKRPFPFWVRDACYVFSKEANDLYEMGFITLRELFRMPLIFASKEILGMWPELERFELFERTDEAARKQRPKIGELFQAHQKIALREITQQERQKRNVYRYSVRVYDHLLRMEQEQLMTWSKEALEQVIEHIDLKSSLWSDLSAPELWMPLIGQWKHKNDIGEWGKKEAEQVRDELQESGRTPTQALDLVRQAVRYPILLPLVSVVVDGKFEDLSNWVTCLATGALDANFDLI